MPATTPAAAVAPIDDQLEGMSLERINALMVVVAAQRVRLERQAAAESGRQAVAAMREEERGGRDCRGAGGKAPVRPLR